MEVGLRCSFTTAACSVTKLISWQKFQDLEEERLDFTKSSLWQYANIASTVCVSDDAVRPSPCQCIRLLIGIQSCEKVRLALENCEVEKDIVYFIKEKGTGQEIPDPPRFINFCRDDINDSGSELSEDDGYSVAQFQRPINPAFRSSSPQPSTYESHHDPQPDQTPRAGHNFPPASSREQTITPQNPLQQSPGQQPPPLDLRRGGQLPPNYDPNQHGEISSVPHNSYPTDGMTMFCRAGPPSERSSATSAHRPSSRDSQSECSNPTSMSSQEPPSNVKTTPTKPANGVALPGIGGGDKQAQKKRSTFFSNSPFRRKSRYDKNSHSPSSSHGGWDTPSKHANTFNAPQPQRPIADNDRLPSPEPADPRANFQLNVGNNVFDVASPDKDPSQNSLQGGKGDEGDLDPVARALADLKLAGKQPSFRVSADRYHGITTPNPPAPGSNYNTNTTATPPPAYNDPTVKRLGAPQPAFTSAQMQKTTQKYAGQTQHMLRGPGNSGGMGARNREQHQDVPRARSPAPRRSASPQVSPRVDVRMGQYSNGASPTSPSYQSNSMRSRYAQSPTASSPQRTSDVGFPPREYSNRTSPSAMPRAVSPQPQFKHQNRPSSAAAGMELQLSGNQADMYGGHDGYGSRGSGRPMSYHDGAKQGGRARSRTHAAGSGRQYSRDGRPVLHVGKHLTAPFPLRDLITRLTCNAARAMYSYTAAIPEELGFTKGDILSVIRLQDDGWWEAELTTVRGRPGLVPSNYLQII